MNYFINRFYLRVTGMLDFFEISLKLKKFIFIKFYSSSKKRHKYENSSIFEDMEISINNKFKRIKNSTNDSNLYINSYNSNGENLSKEKNFEIKILNLKRNTFLYNIKSNLLQKLKNFSKPIKDKEILMKNLDSIIKENKSLLIKNQISINQNNNDKLIENINENELNNSSNSNSINKKKKNIDNNKKYLQEKEYDIIIKNNSF